MPTTTKTTLAWALRMPDGYLVPEAHATKREATESYYPERNWETAYGKGWRMVKVKLVPVKS